jgi:hypothetical protein
MSTDLPRRAFLGRCAGLLGVAAVLSHESSALPPSPIRVTVYKDPNCGCCKAWNAAMSATGFVMDVHDTADLQAVKASLGVPRDLASCHTAVASGYLFEGHVPPDLVQNVLRERPQLVGLFVPGMPAGSPGMEGPNAVRFDVLALGRDGRRTVYASRMGRSQA